jgi:hypothetical protein
MVFAGGDGFEEGVSKLAKEKERMVLKWGWFETAAAAAKKKKKNLLKKKKFFKKKKV